MDLDTYEREGRHAFASLARTVAGIIEKVAEGRPDYRVQQVQHRSKAVTSLRKKLVARNVADTAEIEREIKDLAGVRVVLYTNADVARFISSGVIGDNFEVDWARTKFHYPLQEPSGEDGFISYNYVVKLKADRLALPEFTEMAGLSCEVQVQTTLDHAWSEMAHDTIYKPPPPGFGTLAMQSVADRMAEIMQKYLFPAGFEFQKVAADVRAFERARAIAEQNPLRRIAEAADNNERHARIKEFARTLPYYDDVAARAPEFQRAMVQAVVAARTTPPKPWVVEGVPFAGVTLDLVVDEAFDVIDRLGHASEEAIDGAFQALAVLYPEASDDERMRLHQSLERLAKHDLDIWRVRGPLVEQRLMTAIQAMDRETRKALADLLTETLRHILRTDLTGQSNTYNALTLHMGSVVASETYLSIRSDALSILEDLMRGTRQLAPLRRILNAFQAASRLPDHGTLTGGLLGAILADRLRIVRFMTRQASDLPYEVLQEYEHDLLWAYRHGAALPPDHRSDAALEAHRRAVEAAILEFRDAVNANPEFVIFKILVGYQSVFPPAWEDDSFDFDGQAAYRATAVAELVSEIDVADVDRWLSIIRRCAASDAIVGGGCAGFRTFLLELGRTKPDVLECLFQHLDQGLEGFIASMLQGLAEGGRAEAATARMRAWIAAGEHLGEVIRYLEIDVAAAHQLLADAGRAAMTARDDRCVAWTMGVSAQRWAEARGPMLTVFLDGLTYFEEQERSAWVDQVWYRLRHTEFVDHLNGATRKRILDNLVNLPRLDFHAEDLLSAVVGSTPVELLPFFGKRLAKDRTGSAGERYEAIPFELHHLKEAFAAIPAETVATVREWFATDAKTALFEYRGGALIARAFPQFERVRALLQAFVERGAEGDLDFVLRVLMTYRGAPEILPVCREIVARLEPGDLDFERVDLVLDQSGMVAGEFGFVELHQQRKAEIAVWLSDPVAGVRAFAEQRCRELDLRIAADQRRALEDLELRKRHYGE